MRRYCLFLFWSFSAFAGTQVFECEGPVYDQGADMIRMARAAFAKGWKNGEEIERVRLQFGSSASMHAIEYGVGNCVGTVGGDIECEASTAVKGTPFPEFIHLSRKGSEISFSKYVGLRGHIPCFKHQVDFTVEEISFQSKSLFEVVIRQDNPFEIMSCHADLHGLLNGRLVSAISFGDCRVRDNGDGTRTLALKSLATSGPSPGISYFLNSIEIRTDFESDAMEYYGWAFDLGLAMVRGDVMS